MEGQSQSHFQVRWCWQRAGTVPHGPGEALGTETQELLWRNFGVAGEMRLAH